MSDEPKQEQPSAGGSYIRQPDGSLVRQEALAETKATPPVRKTATKEK